MKVKDAALKTLFWISIAILFNLFLFKTRGETVGYEFLGGYIIELSLSIDNLFLFLMIFKSFNVPLKHQEKILTFGILGAIVFRFIFIFLGVSIVTRFQWVIYIFGVILLISSFKMLFTVHKENDAVDMRMVRGVTKVLPVSDMSCDDGKFFVIKNKRLHITKLFMILILIESSDLMFALDSIPSVFSITTNPFIVYSSNIFAILGLRSMYYLLETLNCMFRFLKYGVSILLMFTGIKLVALFFSIHISTAVSVLVILIILLSSILISLIVDDIDDRRKKRYSYRS